MNRSCFLILQNSYEVIQVLPFRLCLVLEVLLEQLQSLHLLFLDLCALLASTVLQDLLKIILLFESLLFEFVIDAFACFLEVIKDASKLLGVLGISEVVLEGLKFITLDLVKVFLQAILSVLFLLCQVTLHRS
jgi:hypothetical protein